MPGGIPGCKRILDKDFEYRKWHNSLPEDHQEYSWFDYAKTVCTKRVTIDEQLLKGLVPKDVSVPEECKKSPTAWRWHEWRTPPYGIDDYDWKTFLEAFEDTCDHLKQIEEKVSQGELPQNSPISSIAILGGLGAGTAGLSLIPLIKKLITFF